MSDKNMSGWLTDDQVRALVAALRHTADIDGGPDATVEEAEAIVKWAEGVVVDQSCLEGVLSGAMRVRMKDGEPSFSLSAKGNDEARNIIRRAGLDPDNLKEPPPR